MSRAQFVSGGVGPPKIEITGGGDVLRTVYLPEASKFNESYELVTVRNTAVTGGIVDTPRGYRYRVDMEFAALTLDEWQVIVQVFGDYSAGRTLRFYPHEDETGVYYDVVPTGGVAFPYLQGRYLGYEGKVSFVGAEILGYIPCPTAFSCFCSADEPGYSPDEVSYFTDAEEDDYLPYELSYFSGVGTVASTRV